MCSSASKPKRKYFKTTLTLEILTSDCPPKWGNLAELHHLITDGDASGDVKNTVTKEVAEKTMWKLLIAQGSDPEFLLWDDCIDCAWVPANDAA